MKRFEDFIPPLTVGERDRIKEWLDAGLTVDEVLLVIMSRREQLTKENN